MNVDPITVLAETPIVEAIDLMMTHAVTGLPVARDGRLVGMVLQRDVLRIAREMFLERLSATQPLPVRRRVAKPAPKPRHAEV
jgi:CBS domain-containing protein